MGDKAEAQFEAWAAEHNIIFERYGFNRPKFKSFYKLPPFVRNTPDFVVEQPTAKATKKYLVECKGTGGKVLKLKVDYMPIAKRWNDELELYFFIHDSTNNENYLVDFLSIWTLCQSSPIETFEDDGKEYYAVSMKHIKGEETWQIL